MNNVMSNKNVTTATTSSETALEEKLRNEFGDKKGAMTSLLLQKRINKGQIKYFDSGDYNMARARHRPVDQLHNCPSDSSSNPSGDKKTNQESVKSGVVASATNDQKYTKENCNPNTSSSDSSSESTSSLAVATPNTISTVQTVALVRKKSVLDPEKRIDSGCMMSTSGNTSSGVSSTHSIPLTDYESVDSESFSGDSTNIHSRRTRSTTDSAGASGVMRLPSVACVSAHPGDQLYNSEKSDE